MATKVAKVGVKKEKGYLYFVDKKGNKRVLHTLNDTALASSRIMVAILENYQNKDGTITVPKVLVSYMNGVKVIGKMK